MTPEQKADQAKRLNEAKTLVADVNSRHPSPWSYHAHQLSGIITMLDANGAVIELFEMLDYTVALSKIRASAAHAASSQSEKQPQV